MSEDVFLTHHLPGTSPAVAELRRKIEMINSAYNRDLLAVILVNGESGAGKNHVSRVIAGHRYWRERSASNGLSEKQPLASFTSKFAEISLPSLPDSLVESELFGHKKGAFTGASKDRDGLLAGDVVDVLLDEIGDASPTVQTKLLGVLETRRFRPLGAELDDEVSTSARFLLATHRNLGELVRTGAFREDLFWRANEFTLTVPPLREQPENVEALIKYQLTILAPRAMYDKDPQVARPLPTLTLEDLEWATTYAWPGNIRQLRHTLVQWLAHDGSAPLKKLATEAEFRMRSTMSASVATQRTSIRDRLVEARSAGKAAAPTLGALIDEASQVIQSEVVSWYDENPPTADELKRLFPDAEPTSVRSKLSQWRTR